MGHGALVAREEGAEAPLFWGSFGTIEVVP